MLSIKWEKRWDWRKKWMGPLCVIRKMARILGGSAFLLSAWTRLENFPILVSQSEKTKCSLAASWWRKWFPRCHDKKRNKSTSCAAVEFSSGRSIVWWVGHIFHHGGGHWLQNWNAFSFKIRSMDEWYIIRLDRMWKNTLTKIFPWKQRHKSEDLGLSIKLLGFCLTGGSGWRRFQSPWL